MVAVLVQNQVRALPGWQDILVQVDEIDAVPDAGSRRNGFFLVEFGEVSKIGVGLLEHAAAKRQKPGYVPLLDDFLFSINVD